MLLPPQAQDPSNCVVAGWKHFDPFKQLSGEWLDVGGLLLPEPDAEGLGLCVGRAQPAESSVDQQEKPSPVQQGELPKPTEGSNKICVSLLLVSIDSSALFA